MGFLVMVVLHIVFPNWPIQRPEFSGLLPLLLGPQTDRLTGFTTVKKMTLARERYPSITLMKVVVILSRSSINVGHAPEKDSSFLKESSELIQC